MAEGTLKLDKPAKKQGGDRYKGELNGEEITLYLPQSVTRREGRPLSDLSITIEGI